MDKKSRYSELSIPCKRMVNKIKVNNFIEVPSVFSTVVLVGDTINNKTNIKMEDDRLVIDTTRSRS